MEEFEPHLEIVMREMCKRVGAVYEKINFKSNKWYLKYTWTREEEDDFAKWFAKYLYDNNTARKELTVVAKNKKQIQKAVNWFLFNYGWKIKDDTRSNNVSKTKRNK